MSEPLAALAARELDRPVPDAVTAFAARLAVENVVAVLFYGSVLRTGDVSGVLDFYVLTRASPKRLASRLLWPDVGYVEEVVDGHTLRAKVASMPLATFAAAAAGDTLDTTVWTRFCQPARLVWVADAQARAATLSAVAVAARTAAGFAALLGPERGAAADFWQALFRATYTTEFRVEAPGREREIVTRASDWFTPLLPAAWAEAGIASAGADAMLSPQLTPAQRTRLARRWRSRARAGKPLNAARLIKAAFTFQGAARYALWKVERHTGVALPLTPFRERHPVLAAPGVLWRLWRR